MAISPIWMGASHIARRGPHSDGGLPHRDGRLSLQNASVPPRDRSVATRDGIVRDQEGNVASPDHSLSWLKGFDVLDDAAVQRRESDLQGASLLLGLP